ncbi:outer dynein arm protein 1-like [Leguminivora glycinivorella]|uniref:outer dynein arm protein 1-like n=1 Tax=Leguminivora glycinivorella TaxID=1035111 RepID=UPI00200D81B1|nr:outer dynein arm protein 1-like [Leguminivora glycinivorella]
MIQQDRAHRTVGVHPMFRRQDLLLRELRKDYRSMKEDLKIATTGLHKKNEKRMKADLQRSLLLREKTEQQCHGRIVLMEQLEGLLQRDHKNLLELQSRVNASMGKLKERAEQGESRLVATENKLETANRRFNAVQHENKQIREQIEHMLKDRAIFNQNWSKMMAALCKGKKFLTDLFESSSVAYDQRDEWCTKLRSLTEKGRVDQTIQVQEMRDLQKAYDHEMKTYKFLAAKGVMRVNESVDIKQEEMQRKKEEQWQEELDYHTNLLKDIENYTEETNAQRIIEAFEKTEQENFSVYKLLTFFCAENIVLSKELGKIRREIADREDFNESVEVKQRENLEQLTRKLGEVKSRTETLRAKEREKNKLLETNIDKISDIFRMLDLSLEPFQNLLGDKQPSLNQLGLTLCLINDKTKELIETAYYLERKASKRSLSTRKKYTVQQPHMKELTPLPMNLLVPADPCPACTEARWFSRISEALEAPLSRDGAILALNALAAEPAYERSDRIHQLQDCRLPASRIVLAKRYL